MQNPSNRSSSRPGRAARYAALLALALVLAACGRSSAVRYADGGQYHGGDIPLESDANVPSSGGASTF